MANDLPLRPPPPLLDDACALFLDVDGTLIEFADRPDAVTLLPDVREAIGRISDRLEGAVALVSGRPLEQLDALFAPLHLPAAGLHGHQLRDAGGAVHDSAEDESTTEWLHALHQQAMRFAHGHPGVLVEDKGPSMALHWRGAPHAANEVRAFADRHIRGNAGYRLQPGDHVVEFVPVGSDKGRAVRRMMQYLPFRGRLPVFLGDDLTDEHGFEASNGLHGWSVLVGEREPSVAVFQLQDIRSVHGWLRENAW
jgi:trehalose 6-phosphate phosphatase